MARVSNILLLPPEQKAWLDEQLAARVTHREILGRAQERGVPLTTGGLSRYAKRRAREHAAAGEMLARAMERALLERLRSIPDAALVDALVDALVGCNASCAACLGHEVKR